MGCKTCSGLPQAQKDKILYRALSNGQTVGTWDCPSCGNVVTIGPGKPGQASPRRKPKKKKKKRKRK